MLCHVSHFLQSDRGNLEELTFSCWLQKLYYSTRGFVWIEKESTPAVFST